MRKATDQTFGQAFKDWLKSSDMDEKFRTTGILEAWPRLMGPMIAKHTVSVRINNGVLHLVVDSAPLRQELLQSRESILRMLNEEAGAEVVKEIVFR
ncbi:MAG: hypothetical protein RL213_2070 [Bacteroidota bacterium]|jgi:predicted nucleic acid-binding Zn ribbon protein